MNKIPNISALIPAAGKSTRMGQPKILLPWKSTNIISHIISILITSGIDDIIIVYDPLHEAIRNQLESLSKGTPIRLIGKQGTGNEEMFSSIQIGLKNIREDCNAVLITLADQPQVQSKTIESILSKYTLTGSKIIVPSYRLKRGHPWLIDSKMINQILNLNPNKTARDFLKENSCFIDYVDIDNESILQDIDTPGDYRRSIS